MNNKRILLILLVIIIIPVKIAFATKSNSFEQPISISFYQSEFGEVLKELSYITDVKFVYDEKLAKQKVSGTYDQLPLRIVVHRLMRGVSNSLILDEKANTILIEGFGPTRYITTENGNIYFADTGLTYADLEVLKTEQLNKLESERKDTFGEEFNLSGTEIEALREKQLSTFEQEQINGTSSLPGFEMTVEKYQLMIEEQLAEFDRIQNKDEMILPDFDKTVGEYKKIQNEQLAEFNQQQANENEYLPEFGMTRGEQKKLYVQQLKILENQ